MSIICDESDDDRKFMEEFKSQLDMLIGMTEECFVTHTVYLLSPCLRNMMADKGKCVKQMWDKIKYRIHVDNPCGKLE